MSTPRIAWAQGISTVATTADGAPETVLDAWFPAPALGARPSTVDPFIAPAELEELIGEDPLRRV